MMLTEFTICEGKLRTPNEVQPTQAMPHRFITAIGKVENDMDNRQTLKHLTENERVHVKEVFASIKGHRMPPKGSEHIRTSLKGQASRQRVAAPSPKLSRKAQDLLPDFVKANYTPAKLDLSRMKEAFADALSKDEFDKSVGPWVGKCRILGILDITKNSSHYRPYTIIYHSWLGDVKHGDMTNDPWWVRGMVQFLLWQEFGQWKTDENFGASAALEHRHIARIFFSECCDRKTFLI